MHMAVRFIAVILTLSACSQAAAAPTDPLVSEPAAPVATVPPVPSMERPQISWPDVPAPVPDWNPSADAPVEYPPRVVNTQEFVEFATAGPVTLLHPSTGVEIIGFHESTHDGAQAMESTPSVVPWFVMESRDRDTGPTTAADIAVDPGREIRSPVTGTVLRAGTYVLYCEYSDDFLVVEPDERPGWEVKVLHINNVQRFAGDRVEAGVTVIADGPTPLPFRSQVDDATSAPSWPHVHIEVIDPSIPDRPSGGGC